MASHTYAAYVTPPGGSEQTIGTGLAFRSNYASATSLNNVRGAVDGGSIEICPVSLPGAPAAHPRSHPPARRSPRRADGSVTVTAGAGCAWTATSNAAWISITAGGSGTGNGTVSYSVAANGARAQRHPDHRRTDVHGQPERRHRRQRRDVYLDQQDVTFTSGTPGVQAAVVAGEGLAAPTRSSTRA